MVLKPKVMTRPVSFLRMLCIPLLGLFLQLPAVAAVPVIGQKAPDFTLRSHQGKNIKLSEYRGQVVMINFWTTWCGPCRQELPLLNRMHEKYHKAGFQLLGINVDDQVGAAQAMVDRLALRFPVLYDTTKQVSKRYDLDAMPTTLIVDRDGKVRYLHRGYRSGDEKEYEDRIREILK